MAKKKFRFKLPTQQQIFKSRLMRPFAPMFNRHYFWHLNRRRAALSVAIGMFCGLMPGPTQMLSALIAAYFLRANLPVSVFTTLYTNPFTYMPLYYLAYQIGCIVLGVDAGMFVMPELGENFWAELRILMNETGKALLVGVPILGILLALVGYISVSMIWRITTSKRWKQRGGTQ